MSAAPTLPGAVHIAPDKDQLFDDLAMALIGAAQAAVAQRGVFHMALSGGSTPEPFYVRMVIDPSYRGFPWDRTHLWLVDERRVPEDDERSNYRMIREAMADHVPMRRRQRHPMPVLADDPAAAYETELREVFNLGADQTGRGRDIPRMDFLLLGMGDDAHTASLFPGSAALQIADRWVAVNEGRQVTPPPRVTMTYPLINAARHVAVLVAGRDKAATLHRIQRRLAEGGGPQPTELPITGVDPEAHGDGELVWYLDQAAAGQAPEHA